MPRGFNSLFKEFSFDSRGEKINKSKKKRIGLKNQIPASNKGCLKKIYFANK